MDAKKSESKLTKYETRLVKVNDYYCNCEKITISTPSTISSLKLSLKISSTPFFSNSHDNEDYILNSTSSSKRIPSSTPSLFYYDKENDEDNDLIDKYHNSYFNEIF
ncbi:hypothetical protein ACTFIR_003854 [Dictyostelium discoideum]